MFEKKPAGGKQNNAASQDADELQDSIGLLSLPDGNPADANEQIRNNNFQDTNSKTNKDSHHKNKPTLTVSPLDDDTQPLRGQQAPLEDGAQGDKTTREQIISENKQQMPPNISELIGEFGLYQLSLAFITLIRYICVAMMTNTGPLLAPELDFACQLPINPLLDKQVAKLNFTTPNSTAAILLESSFQLMLKNKCQLELENKTVLECTRFAFNTTSSGATLTDTYGLVCDRSWLRSAFQSSVSLGVMIASVLFGSFSDEHGRRLTMLVSCAISLVAGLASWWAPNFLIYTLARSICSMCDLGIVGSLYTTIVETLGNKYRGAVCLVVFTGWSLGVMVMPWITGHFMDFRQVMLFTVVCHLVTLPWILTVGESVRWLLVHGHIAAARREIHRICRWNLKSGQGEMARVDSAFELLKVKYELMAQEREAELKAKGPGRNTKFQIVRRSLFGGLSKVGQIFKSRELTITTCMIIWTTFNSELLYMLFIMINSDVGDNVKLNYAIGGFVETLATILSIVMISGLTRRVSLSATLATISASVFCLAFTHHLAGVSVWTLNFTKLAISTLSSLVYVIVTELFPTSLRQTGMGLAGTLGSLGAVIAPFIRTELVDMIGMTNVMLALCFLPLSAAILIPFFLRETKGVELADDVNDICEPATKSTDRPNERIK